MTSPVRILGAFVDTLYLNAYPTDSTYHITKKRIADELKLELDQYKQMAQEEEENIPTRFVFDGLPLMTMKGQLKSYDSLYTLAASKIGYCYYHGSSAPFIQQGLTLSLLLVGQREAQRAQQQKC